MGKMTAEGINPPISEHLKRHLSYNKIISTNKCMQIEAAAGYGGFTPDFRGVRYWCCDPHYGRTNGMRDYLEYRLSVGGGKERESERQRGGIERCLAGVQMSNSGDA